MAKHMRPPRRRTGRILRGIVTHAGGRVGLVGGRTRLAAE